MNVTTLQSVVGNHRRLILSALAVISFVLFIISDLAPLNQNDFMYALAPAVWAQHGALYTDVPFIQAPLSVLLNWLLVAVTGNVNIFLPGHLCSIVFVLVAVLLPLLDRSKTRDVPTCLLYVALCLTNLYVSSNSREMGNYAIPLLCLSAAVTVINAPGSAVWRGFAGCAAIGLATSAKLYFAIVCPGIFLYFLFNDRSARNPIAIAACGFGFLVGFAPILFFLARDYQGFLRSNVQFHQLMLPLRVPSPAAGAFRITISSLMFALLMCVPIGFMIAKTRNAWRRGGAGLGKVCGELLLLASTYAMAMSPIYIFEQYLGPLAFLLLLFSMPWNSADQASRWRYAFLAVAMLCVQFVVLGQLISRYVTPDGNLQVVQVVKAQDRARQIVGDGYRCERKLYSTSPLFLLENDVKYPPELAAGPFWMFLRGEAVARKGKQFDLDAHIKAWNPDVVIWGFYLNSANPAEAAVDREIRDYAFSHAFKVARIGQVDGQSIELGYRADCRPQKTSSKQDSR